MLLNLFLSPLDAGGPVLAGLMVGVVIFIIAVPFIIISAVLFLTKVTQRNKRKRAELAAQADENMQTPPPPTQQDSNLKQ